MSDSFAILWAVACQAPLSMGFPRQEYWSGWLFPSPGDLPCPGIEPRSPALQADSLPLSHKGIPGVNLEDGESGDSWNVKLNKGELVNLEPLIHHTGLAP